MTSKISFFKLLQEDFKRRSWLFAIISLLFFLVQPVALLMRLDGRITDLANGLTSLGEMQEFFMSYLALGGQVMTMFIMVVAIVCGVSGFSYLHSRVKLDFYHSLAIKRKKLFFVQYMGGFLMYAIPYFISILICLLIGGMNGLLTGTAFVLVLKAFLFRSLCFLLIYGVTILATVLTGKIIVAILGTGVFLFYGTIVVIVIVGLCSVFFSTYVEIGSREIQMTYSSPAVLAMVTESLIAYSGNASDLSAVTLKMAIYIGVLIVETLVVTGLAVWTHGIRKSEAAGNAIAFPRLEPIIKVFLVIPLSVLVGIYLSSMMSNNNSIWLYGGIIAGVIILSAVIEFIYHANMKEIFSNKLQIIVVGVVTIIATSVFKFDLFRYDTYLPAKDSVQKMSVYHSGVNGSFVYKIAKDGSITYYDTKTALNETLTENFDSIYELAETGVELQKELKEFGNYAYITIEYVLSNGRKVYREYQIGDDLLVSGMNKMFEEEAYKEKLYPIFSRSVADVKSIDIESISNTEMLDFTKDQRVEFLAIYKEELLAASFEDVSENITATLSLTYSNGQHEYTENSYPISKSFTKTIAYIEEQMGDVVTAKVDPDMVSQIEIYGYNNTSGSYISEVYTANEDIEKILQEIEPKISAWTNSYEDYTIDILLNDGAGIYGKYYFKNGKQPSWLGQSNN